jgi:DNA-binding IclR family transcriptional regulator
MKHNTIQWNKTMIDTLSRESSTNRSLERALSLLLVLEHEGRSMGLTELSRAMELAKPTVRRLMLVLGKYGFAEKWRGRYQLGVAVLPLAHAYLMGKDLTRVALPVLQELAQASEETASLFVRLGFQRVVVQRVDGRFPLRYVLPIGQRLPLHIGVGKVLAAAMPEEELGQMLDTVGEIHLATGQRVTREELLCELDQIRRQGYVVCRNERILDAASVGAPVVDTDGVTIAAVAVASRAGRMTPKKLRELLVEVRSAAKAISDRCNAG